MTDQNEMQYYLAPMEGITNYIYRKIYHCCFAPADKYFTPFINPHTTRSLNNREMQEILPMNHEGMYLVPQILTNQAEDFIRVAKVLREYGYEEVNLNLGCPSGTVVSKKKGAGFLEFPTRIDHFLEEVFAALEPIGMKVSVKTRLGLSEADEFDPLLRVFNKYPLHELIIHPRVRTDYYKNQVDLEAFARALQISENPVCYNGDLFTLVDFQTWRERFPTVGSIMTGRGSIANPGLIGSLRTGRFMQKEQLWEFQDRICTEYEALRIGDRNTLFKMKELWHYWICNFDDARKQEKAIKKSQTMERYKATVAQLFCGCQFMEGAGYQGQ